MKGITSLLLLFGIPGVSAPLDGVESPTIVLGVFDRAGVPAPVLAEARLELAGLLQKINVRVIWADAADRPSAGHCAIWMVIVPRAGHFKVDPRALGFAPGNGSDRNRAYAFYDRIGRSVQRHRDRTGTPMKMSQLLALVLAHEVGHVLLVDQAHSPRGLMRANWNQEDLGAAAKKQLGFSDAQGSRLRQAISLRPLMPVAKAFP